MSKQMRDILDKFKDLSSEQNFSRLRRRLPSEFFESINQKENLTESTLNRLYSHIKNHNCAVITAFRNKLINCKQSEDVDKKINIHNNKGRNKQLKSALLLLGYNITDVKGSYVENYMKENSVEVKEDSYFVVNSTDNPYFIKDIIDLGELFCQDSVMIIERGGDNIYLVGTNNNDFPGYGNTEKLGKFKPGLEGQFMTKVGGRPFVVESFKTLQNNTKHLVERYGRPIVDMIRF